MSWFGRIALLVALLVVAAPAHAVDLSYYTYGGFDKTNTAFRTIALITSDIRFEHLAFTFAVAGIAIGVVTSFLRGGMSLVKFGFQMLVGAGIFSGLIATSGTIHLYDPVRNDYQPIGGVPNLVVILAGSTNMVERTVIDIVDASSGTLDRQVSYGAGGHLFRLLYNAVTPQAPMVTTNLDMTVKSYVERCVPVATASASYGLTAEELYQTSTDLQPSLAKANGPSTFSLVYNSANPSGLTQSCEEAWTHIDTELNTAGLFDRYARGVCAGDDFNVSRAAQLVRCKQQLAGLSDTMFRTPLSEQKFFVNLYLARTIGDILFEESPSVAARVMANRAIVTTGLSTMATADELLPTLKAIVFAVMLVMVSVSLLFLLTPLFGRVATYSLGLFVFIAVWGVVDAAIYRMTYDQAMIAFMETASNNVAVNAWLTAPESAMKTLGMFGTYRTAAAAIAASFVFTVFRLSGNAFEGTTNAVDQTMRTAAAGAASVSTSEGSASAFSTQATAASTLARVGKSEGFGAFAQNSTFGGDRDFAAASALRADFPGSGYGATASALGRTDGARTAGGLDAALAKAGGNLFDPKVASAVNAQAATEAIASYAAGDASRDLAALHFGGGRAGERMRARSLADVVAWKATGETAAYDRAHSNISRELQRSGLSPADADRKASGLISDVAMSPVVAKLAANANDRATMIGRDITAAQATAGTNDGMRAAFGGQVTQRVGEAVRTEQQQRAGSAEGARNAAAQLGLGVEETSRRIGFVNALSGEARSSAITRLANETGRNEAQVLGAMETFNTARTLGTADGTTAQLAARGETVHGFSAETARFDTAERSGKRDAQAEVGTAGVSSAARIGEQRRQAENFGFAAGAAAAGSSVREAANLNAFVGAVQSVAGNRVEMANGGAGGIADRAGNAATERVVANERLSRAQNLLSAFGIDMDKRDIARSGNGDFGFNLSPAQAREFAARGLITPEQLGAIGGGGVARVSLAGNDMVVSSSAAFQRSSSADTSSRIEAGRQLGSDTASALLQGGAEGQARFADFARGALAMGSDGKWHVGDGQFADTLVRDGVASLSTTGWQRQIGRDATDSNNMTTSGEIGLGAGGGGSPRGGSGTGSGGGSGRGGEQGTGSPFKLGPTQSNLGVRFSTTESGLTSETASATLDTTTHAVRSAVQASAEASGGSPERFAAELSQRLYGEGGLRERRLSEADSARGTRDLQSPLTSREQKSVLDRGRFSNDSADGDGDGPR